VIGLPVLTPLTNRVIEQVSVIDHFLSLCEACDEAVADTGSILHAELSAQSMLPLNLRQEKIFRHCAVITQLYAIYEAFCEEVLAYWLARLPDYQTFPNLAHAFRNAYRYGIAKLIKGVETRRYRHLNITDVVKKYLISLEGQSSWEFVTEALTLHERNLRREEIERMFHSAGLSGLWAWLERDSEVANLTVNGSSNKTLEQTILDLVTYRNDASHGSPDEILGIDTLREWTAFVVAFCNALAAFITHQIVNQEFLHKPESVYGVVTETFRDNILVATCNRGWFCVGSKLYFFRETGCVYARIESLQVNDQDRTEVYIDHEGFELGIRTSEKVPRNSSIVSV